MNKEMTYRMEKDVLREKKIPREVYWGIHTERARENFPISGYRVNPSLIKALAVVESTSLSSIAAAACSPGERCCQGFIRQRKKKFRSPIMGYAYHSPRE